MRSPDTQRNAALTGVADQMLRVFEDGAPAVIRQVGSIFETQEVFDWVRQAHSGRSESLRKIIALQQGWGLDVDSPPPSQLHPGRGAEVYRSGALLLDGTPYVPSAAHPTFEAWVHETREALGGEFGMQAPGLECTSFDALARLQILLAPILAITGPRTYRYNAFLGDYRRTPFGFHVDPHQEGVFQYVLHGRRRVLLWDGLTLSKEDARWVEDSNGRATPSREPEVVFELEPGDLVFWPGTHVHGFEPDGPSMALSIVIDRASPRERSEVEAALQVATMGGRAALPPVSKRAAIASDATIERHGVFPIAYEQHDETLIVGACGRTFEWPGRFSIRAAVRLFEYLNAHRKVAVSEVLETCVDETLDTDEVLKALSMLAGLGFLREATNDASEPQ